MENETKPADKQQKKDIGALWLKKSQKTDTSYLSGSIKLPSGETMKVLVFKNKYKNSSNQPDYRIFPDEKLATEKPAATPAFKDEDEDSEIPF
jgi:uncharacterized protein (DUF736 family)